jgi:hypothetical protein
MHFEKLIPFNRDESFSFFVCVLIFCICCHSITALNISLACSAPFSARINSLFNSLTEQKKMFFIVKKMKHNKIERKNLISSHTFSKQKLNEASSGNRGKKAQVATRETHRMS